MKNLNNPEMVMVHKNALIEYMKYALCVCQGCTMSRVQNGCRNAKCPIHMAETIIERDLYRGKNHVG